MSNKFTSKSIYLLLLIIFILNSCNGRTKTESQSNNGKQSGKNLIEQHKMQKTQGNYIYRTATGPYSDASVSINSIIEDRNGNIWAATMGEGVYLYDGKSFVNFTVKDGLPTNLVYTMMEDKEGNIWFGTTDGVSRYNGKSFTNFTFSIFNANTNTSFSNNRSDPLKEQFKNYKEVWSMLQDRTGKIWIGTTNGVYCFDGDKFISIADLDTSKNNSLKHITVTAIAEDQKGNIWFTSWADGLCLFDGKTIIKVSSDGEGFNSMLLDRNENFWLGRRDDEEGGVYRYDGITFNKVFIGMPYITEIEEDKEGNIWFSNVPNGGVIYYNPTSENISRFTKKDGLANNNISAITIDKSGKVWFGMSDLTLTSYDGKTFTNF